MPKSYFVEQRKVFKRQLLDFIKKQPGVPISKVIGVFSLQTGLRVSTVETYVEELKQAEVLE